MKQLRCRCFNSLTWISVNPPQTQSEIAVSPPVERLCIDSSHRVDADFPPPEGQREWMIYSEDWAPLTIPIHDTCLEIARRMQQWRHTGSGDRLIELDGLKVFSESLFLQYERNEKVRTSKPGVAIYTFHGLDWEHRYYGAEKFWDERWWNNVRGWEVSPCSKL